MITDDTSEWAFRQQCYKLINRLDDAKQQFEFAQGAASFPAPYAATITAYLQHGCAPDPAYYRAARERAVSGLIDPTPAR